MKFILSILALLLTLPALAAGTVQQSGNVTTGHSVMWTTNGVVQDGGPATAGNLTELGITKNGGLALCINSAPISQPYNELCLGVGTSAAATLSLQNYGGATAQPLRFVINGQSYDFPFTTNGNVVGPNSSTIGHAAVFANTTGTLLSDAGADPDLLILRKVSSGTTDTAATSDATIAWTSTATSTKTETLYSCGSSVSGRKLVIKDAAGTSATYPIVLSPAGGQTIDAQSTYPIYFNSQSVTIQCDGGTNWEIE